MALINLLTKTARRYLVGPDQEFVFKKIDKKTFFIPKTKKIGLYIHIPFCKSICPFCPYNKIKYDKALTEPYLQALLKEIDIYYQKLGKVEISSIYIGGGTPTNMIDEIGAVLEEIKEKFSVTGNICIETNVSDITEEKVKKLKEYGINLLSLGVQSFQDKFLKFLGRNYQKESIEPIIKLIKKENFDSVNIDLMFALKSQTKEDVFFDLQKAIDLGVDQITTYPLFTFPYTSIGRFLQLKNLKMPNLFTRRKMYKAIHNFLLQKGFSRVSVWGFKRGDVPKYSSVTRDYYIGLGAGAASSFENMFYFNTFSVHEYIKTLSNKILPVSIKMDISNSLSKTYQLYWRLYDTHFSVKQANEIYKNNPKAKKVIQIFKLLRLCKEENETISLTERGAFWIHLAQNYFVLNYINKVWTKSMQIPWPDKIEL